MESDEISLSMQKAPEDGFVRLLAFDLNPETYTMKLVSMQPVTQEDYDKAVGLLEEYVRMKNNDIKIIFINICQQGIITIMIRPLFWQRVFEL